MKASYTCSEKEGEILDFEVGEYLEVLAQLDRSWLYCANGQQEGLVRIGWTEPLIDQTIFETLHDNFYR